MADPLMDQLNHEFVAVKRESLSGLIADCHACDEEQRKIADGCAIVVHECGGGYRGCVEGMTRDSPTPDSVNRLIARRIIEVMNRATKTDRDAIASLIQQRVWCNETLLMDPAIQVQDCRLAPYHDLKTGLTHERRPPGHEGLVGILLGLTGTLPESAGKTKGWSYVVAKYENYCPAHREQSKSEAFKDPGVGGVCPVEGCGQVIVLGDSIRFELTEREDEP